MFRSVYYRKAERKPSEETARHSDAEACLAPVPPLSIVSDSVTSSESDPLGNRSVLLLRLCKLLLGTESLVALVKAQKERYIPMA